MLIRPPYLEGLSDTRRHTALSVVWSWQTPWIKSSGKTKKSLSLYSGQTSSPVLPLESLRGGPPMSYWRRMMGRRLHDGAGGINAAVLRYATFRGAGFPRTIFTWITDRHTSL